MNKFLLLFLIIAIASCNKETEQQLPAPPIDPNTVFPNYVTSDAKGEYYIEGEFNDKYLCFSPSMPSTDIFSNAYYFNESIEMDQLNLIRMNTEGSAQIQIYLGQSKMLKRQIPYYLPHENLAVCEFTQFQFYDEHKRTGTENAPNDNYTYQASTNTGMQLTVTSFLNNIIEGNFEGTLRTNTGLIMKVKNGKFKIKIFTITSI